MSIPSLMVRDAIWCTAHLPVNSFIAMSQHLLSRASEFKSSTSTYSHSPSVPKALARLPKSENPGVLMMWLSDCQ